MRAIPSRRSIFLGRPLSPLLGATWARNSSGMAYNTPTLGAELLANNGFATDTNWTKDPGWTIGSGVASHTTPTGGIYQVAHSSGNWYQVVFDVVAYTSGNVYALMGGSSLGPNRSALGTYVQTGRAAGAGSGVGATGTASVDNVSSKQITVSALHAYRLGTSNSQIAAARISALTTGTQAGAFALVDNPSNPQNGIYAYHDGTGVTLDKLVAGTWSNVVSRVTLAFSADMEVMPVPIGGNQWQLWAGGSQRGSTVTISDASIVNNRYYGLFSTYSANLFSGFTLDNQVIPFGF